MGNRHVSVTIAALPETVFRLYTDPGQARDWQSGVRDLRTTGPPDQPGSRAVIVYRWPFRMTAEVLQVEPPARHVQRLKELLGVVTCTTTARFRRVEGGTELRLEMAYRVAGGPIGRLFDARVGGGDGRHQRRGPGQAQGAGRGAGWATPGLTRSSPATRRRPPGLP
jgi:uncharacterized protein YndB with AHSA1/START domain